MGLSLKSLFKNGFFYQIISKELKTVRAEQGPLCQATTHSQVRYNQTNQTDSLLTKNTMLSL